MPETLTKAGTLVDALQEALQRTAAYNANVQVAPAALLWTDKKREWERLLPRLRQAMPHLLTLGEYAPEDRTGPAIWLKCMVARALPEADWPEGKVPVLYLPGVSRQDVRAVEQCPEELQPLAELQYRGELWTQYNGRDWTVRAFMVTEEGGLNLNVARDDATQEALQRALPALADTPLANLRGRHLEADDFNAFVTRDPVRDLLLWIDDPESQQEEWADEHWSTFRDICQDRFEFDPVRDGALPAARKLGLKEGPWAAVWRRFQEAPKSYPHLPEKLEQARPPSTGDLFAREPSWPQDNEALEDDLRDALLGLAGKRQDQAAQAVRDLEEKHGERRDTVWASLNRAPLAHALRPLCALADATDTAVGGGSPEVVAEAYREADWRADAAALDALESAREPDDAAAVRAATQALYQPWLERSAEALQESVRTSGMPDVSPPEEVGKGTALLFVDALRFDVGKRLAKRLRFEGFHVDEGWRWAAFPTVTATAKPALTPVAEELSRQSEGDGFRPELDGENKGIDTYRFRKRMEAHDFQVLADGETGDPSGKAWSEIGALDRTGHDQGLKLAWRTDELLREVRTRIQQLLQAGWDEVRVVTDHGWLLAPGGLPKEDLLHHLAETRWGRCALLKEDAHTDWQVAGWTWNSSVRIPVSPGISVHTKGMVYAHGGLSPQESITPRLKVTATEGDEAAKATIAGVEWRRLRCRVQVEHPTSGLTVDVRTRASAPDTSIVLRPKVVKENGSASLAVPEPDREGEAATLVLLRDAEVLDTHPTTVGG